VQVRKFINRLWIVATVLWVGLLSCALFHDIWVRWPSPAIDISLVCFYFVALPIAVLIAAHGIHWSLQSFEA